MDDTVHIACCFDRHMELPFLVLANSIKRHLAGDRKVVLHAFHSDPLTHDRAFSRSLDALNFEVRFRPVQNQYEAVPVIHFKTAVTLLRFMLPALLEDVGRLLYLDTDMIVRRDMAELFDTDIGGHALAAVLEYSFIHICTKNRWVHESGSNAWTVQEYLTEIVQLSDWRTYFNAGVLVMDLDRFRKEGLVATAMDYLERMAGKHNFNDQDALNHVINGAFVSLDPRWNVNANVRPAMEFDGAEARFAHAAAIWESDPWILHYCVPGKPWIADSRGTPWDGHFWREAAECEVLPLLAGEYLKQCEERGIIRLQSPETLLACGKPALDKGKLAAHARKFTHIPEVSAAALQITADLDRSAKTDDPRSLPVAVDLFQNKGGAPEGGTLVFNLADAGGHMVHGPYLWYPPGNYEAIFEISLTPGAGGRQARLVIEVTDDSFRFLAQRFLAVTEDLSEPNRTLNFSMAGGELFLEFRIFADGFDGGMLRFSGVVLRKAGQNPQQALLSHS